MSSTTADWYVLPPSPVQARVLALVDTFYRTFKRPCPNFVVAEALDRDHTTIRHHFAELHRKGWLESEGSPAKPTRAVLTRDS